MAWRMEFGNRPEQAIERNEPIRNPACDVQITAHPPGLAARSVITSYSIHYTKLYEPSSVLLTFAITSGSGQHDIPIASFSVVNLASGQTIFTSRVL